MPLSTGAQMFTLVALERVCSLLSVVITSCFTFQREFYVSYVDCMLIDHSKYTFLFCVLITNGLKT